MPYFPPVWLLTGWIGFATPKSDPVDMPSRPRIPFALDDDSPWSTFRRIQELIPGSVFAGRSAAWLLGIRHVDPIDPLEVIVPMRSGMRSRRWLHVRRANLLDTDVAQVRHVRMTALDRMLSDLCPRLTGAEGLALLDVALRLRLADRAALLHSRSLSVRALAPLAEPAESPMETRLRWLLVRAGLPRPEVQATIPEARARADLFYPGSRLIIEYDGDNHRDRVIEDNRRQNLLVSAGYTVLRFTASDIYQRPRAVADQVSAAVAASSTRPAAARR